MGMQTDFTQAFAKLEELERKVAREVSDKALKAGAKEILKEQRKEVPRDTGELEKSLEISKAKGSGSRRKVNVGIASGKAEEVRYGYYQEHGTRVMLGKKWMKRSYYKANDKAIKEMADTLADELRGL